MTADEFTVGAYVRGGTASPRFLCSHADLFAAYADGRMIDRDLTGEAYLSHYAFADDYRAHYETNGGSVAGFAGPCWCRHVVIDLDRPDPADALADARKLVAFFHQRYPELEGDVPVYFSGGKGYHVLLELAHRPPPGVGFHRTAKALAKALAAGAGVTIDESVYDIAHPIRLPNTRHPKTGRFKRRLDADALFRLDVAAIRDHARHPAGDGIPAARRVPEELATDWAEAERHAARVAEVRADRRAGRGGTPDRRAPRFFLDLLRFGVAEGERHHTLFRAAAWLTEQGAPPSLSFALLTEAGQDVGIGPKDVERQIACGIDHATRQGRVAEPMFPPMTPLPRIRPDELETWVRRAGWDWETIRDHLDRTGAYCPDAGTAAALSNPQRAELVVLAMAAVGGEGGAA
jgi:hypothetical protein